MSKATQQPEIFKYKIIYTDGSSETVETLKPINITGGILMWRDMDDRESFRILSNVRGLNTLSFPLPKEESAILGPDGSRIDKVIQLKVN